MTRAFSLSTTFGSLLLSLLVALVIWIAAANNDLVKKTAYPTLPEQRGIPIELRNVPPGLIVTEGEAQRTWIDLLIHRERERDLAPDDIVAYADLSGLGMGRHQVEVVVGRQPLAPNFKILGESPNRISVQLDAEMSQELPIEVLIPDIGTVAQNYQVLTPTISPPTLTIVGPAALVEPIRRVVAEVKVEGARETVVKQVQPTLLNQAGEVVSSDELQLSAAELEATIPIEQKPGYRELIVRTVITGTSQLAERGFWISGSETNPPLVAVVGQQRVVEALNGIVETEPVEVGELSEGTIIRQVPLELPDGISPVDDDFVTVTIRVEPQTSSKTVSLRPTIVGLAPGLTVSESAIVPATVDVLLRGPIRELEELNLDKISATLDLSDKGVGSHLIRPKVSVPGNLRAESLIPEQVEVTITEQTESENFLILVQAVGLPSRTYAAFSPRFVTVTLEGPALQMARFDPMQLAAVVDITGLTGGPYTLSPTVAATEPYSVTEMLPTEVSLRLFGEEELLVVTTPVRVINVDPALVATLNTSVAIVRVAGPGTEAALTGNVGFSVVVDAATLGAGSYNLLPQVRLPAGYEVVNLVPERMNLRLASVP